MKIKLSKAVDYRDGKIKELELELENLTGYDVLSVESELRSSGATVAAWEYSREFLLGIAARASKLPVEVLKGLNVKDFSKVINEVLIFLAGSVSEDLPAKS